jgi:hypothetical protein
MLLTTRTKQRCFIVAAQLCGVGFSFAFCKIFGDYFNCLHCRLAQMSILGDLARWTRVPLFCSNLRSVCNSAISLSISFPEEPATRWSSEPILFATASLSASGLRPVATSLDNSRLSPSASVLVGTSTDSGGLIKAMISPQGGDECGSIVSLNDTDIVPGEWLIFRTSQ